MVAEAAAAYGDRRPATGDLRILVRAHVGFHTERQDTSAPGRQHLLELVDEAAVDGREEFRPLIELSPEERRQAITLSSPCRRASPH
ncbi:hypothetical protein ACHGLA_01035 [Streptomyces sp. YH02]|uniref:hypothetical protein n=1 Tax=Streptomyces sp. YH02 TaxID=3256999 RepID=UPI0037569BCF